MDKDTSVIRIIYMCTTHSCVLFIFSPSDRQCVVECVFSRLIDHSFLSILHCHLPLDRIVGVAVVIF